MTAKKTMWCHHCERPRPVHWFTRHPRRLLPQPRSKCSRCRAAAAGGGRRSRAALQAIVLPSEVPARQCRRWRSWLDRYERVAA